MKIFISWSGAKSRAVAEALRGWLPQVIQAVQPWVSAEDIDKGTRWTADVASQLQESRVGIICLTPENLEAPWILFEAGALSKTLERTFVCPYLFDVRPSELEGPLAQFQATKAEEADTRKLLHTINKALGEQSLSSVQIDSAFQKWWSDLDNGLQQISPLPSTARKPRAQQAVLEEILELVRGLTRTLSSDSQKIADAETLLRLSSVNELFSSDDLYRNRIRRYMGSSGDSKHINDIIADRVRRRALKLGEIARKKEQEEKRGKDEDLSAEEG